MRSTQNDILLMNDIIATDITLSWVINLENRIRVIPKVETFKIVIKLNRIKSKMEQ